MKKITTGKRKPSRTTSASRAARTRTEGPELYPLPNAIYFPEACGKTLAGLYINLDLDDNSVTLTFSDKTALTLDFEPGFTVRAGYSDWTTGKERIIKRSPRFRSASIS
jgi:hypothetical protein